MSYTDYTDMHADFFIIIKKIYVINYLLLLSFEGSQLTMHVMPITTMPYL